MIRKYRKWRKGGRKSERKKKHMQEEERKRITKRKKRKKARKLTNPIALDLEIKSVLKNSDKRTEFILQLHLQPRSVG